MVRAVPFRNIHLAFTYGLFAKMDSISEKLVKTKRKWAWLF